MMTATETTMLIQQSLAQPLTQLGLSFDDDLLLFFFDDELLLFFFDDERLLP